MAEFSVKDKGTRLIITGTTSTKELVKAGPFVISSILWRDPTAIGHKAIFVDNDEDFECGFDQAAIADQPMQDDFPHGHMVNDLYCNDLDSGEIIIYYKSHF